MNYFIWKTNSINLNMHLYWRRIYWPKPLITKKLILQAPDCPVSQTIVYTRKDILYLKFCRIPAGIPGCPSSVPLPDSK